MAIVWAKIGDIEIHKYDFIRFNVWDSDDFHTWRFTYFIKNENEAIYLGGGMDFGSAVGDIESKEEVLDKMELGDNELDLEILGNNGFLKVK